MKPKHVVVALIGAALLLVLFYAKAPWHAPAAIAAFMIAWMLDRDVTRGLGRPGRWLVVMFVLVGLGAWLGPHDAKLSQLFKVPYSRVGAFAGVTMAARAVGLLLLTTALTRAIDPARVLERLAGSAARPLAASVVVALRLAPELGAMLRARAGAARRRSPGLFRAPSRWFEVLVVSIAHASNLADSVALDMRARAADSGSAGAPKRL